MNNNIPTPKRHPSDGRAVAYLRVSSRGQVETDYAPEGNSIPAQREACETLAARMGLTVVDEYVEPGKSARSIDGRPAFRQMMGRIRNARDVDYIVVYMRSRLFRDATDAALTKRRCATSAWRSCRSRTPPTTRRPGTSWPPHGRRLQRVPIEDLRAGHRLQDGGQGRPWRHSRQSPTQLPERPGDRRRPRGATVAVDPDRAPTIRMLFEHYATGQHSFPQLRELATAAGLRTRPTRKYPAGTPVSIHKLGQILRDRCYLGYCRGFGASVQVSWPCPTACSWTRSWTRAWNALARRAKKAL